METLILLSNGVMNALSLSILAATFAGVIVGLIVGALPGLGPAAGVAIMLPVAVGFGGVAAIAGLAGIYYGAMFGGAVTSILLGIPGDAPAVMTVIDGHAMAKKGLAGEALGMSVFASFAGGIIGLVLMTMLSLPIAHAALKFGPTEMAALMCFAFSLVSVLGGHNIVKGFVSLFIGIWIGMIGLDPIVGPARYTFGLSDLNDGVDFTILAVGLFGLTEIFMSLTKRSDDMSKVAIYSFRSLFPRVSHVVKCKTDIFIGSIVGFLVGVLPGLGATAATMLSYAASKKLSKHPEEFGNGAIEGVASPEAANNSASYAAMIPLFTLGIPGSATTAILLGGLMMIGLQPGPMLFTNNPDFVWTVFGTFWVGNLMLFFLTLLLIPLLSGIVFVSTAVLYPIVVGIVVYGVYSINSSMADVLIALISGCIGYVMLKLDYSLVPLVLGVVLGPLLENNIRRTLILTDGDLSVFVERPISLAFIILTVLVVLAPVIRRRFRGRQP